MELFGDIYRGKRVIITGHTGFKGSWLYTLLLKLGADVKGISLTPPTKPSHFELCNYALEDGPIDIKDFKAVRHCLDAFKPEIIFHLASQPIVSNSYIDPKETYETNVFGAISLYEACRKLDSLRAVVNITSDKVYDTEIHKDKYVETDRLGGYDPYSSSKACVEVIVRSYINSYFNIKDYNKSHHLLVGIPRAGNVIGGGDWAIDRIIPDIVRAVFQKTALKIRYPESVRPWQHVLDCLSGYLLLGQNLLEGKTCAAGPYNFGPGEESYYTVSDIIQIARNFWPDLEVKLIQSEQPYEAKYIQLDSGKAKADLSWAPTWDSKTAIKKAFQWYYDFYTNDNICTHKQIDEYISDASLKAVWVKRLKSVG